MGKQLELEAAMDAAEHTVAAEAASDGGAGVEAASVVATAGSASSGVVAGGSTFGFGPPPGGAVSPVQAAGAAAAQAHSHPQPSEHSEVTTQNCSTRVVPDDDPIWCMTCNMWVNGPGQWEDHKIGKKHRKNLARAEAMRGP